MVKNAHYYSSDAINRGKNNRNREMAEDYLKTNKSIRESTDPKLYNTWGIMSMPVLGSTIGRKHSSIIVRATANFMLHSAFKATNRWAE